MSFFSEIWLHQDLEKYPLESLEMYIRGNFACTMRIHGEKIFEAVKKLETFKDKKSAVYLKFMHQMEDAQLMVLQYEDEASAFLQKVDSSFLIF